jgi:UV damage endonuclease UvdE
MVEDQTQTKKLLEEQQRPLNTRSTTNTWLQKQSYGDAIERLYSIVNHNLDSVKRQLEYVDSLGNDNLRMMRISSDLLPFYTHADWRDLYKNRTFLDVIERKFADIGKYSRDKDIRLSFHPGQFTCLASDRPEVVERSIEEFEYHVDMVRWMGYGQRFQDFKCNVHIGGRLGPDGIRAVYPRLSTEAKNVITLENDEMSWGLNSVLSLSDIIPVVMDLHHHWVRNGEYIQPDDDRVKQVIDSWRGVRPTMHYSYSRDEALPEGFDHTTLPDMAQLLEQGHKKQKLRAHSDFYPNELANRWALSFWPYFDIMCESKCKNLASIKLYEFWENNIK